jgi:formylglycine-generating enzyme required for sulfatase activity
MSGNLPMQFDCSNHLKDGSYGPKMVLIPAGKFRMGDIQRTGYNNEQPLHEVSMERFAIGRYPVTVYEFKQFVNATGYKTEAEKGHETDVLKGLNWRNPSFSQTDNHPVVCVTWNDALAYIEWLSEQTRQKYRLPTEAEWEYAARAGTETKYWWGNDIDESKANYSWNLTKTSPVGSYAANKFGLYDTVGNVWEWICSEYTNKYNGNEKQCVTNASRFVLRGGSWYDVSGFVRSASRDRNTPTVRDVIYGFRMVMILTP